LFKLFKFSTMRVDYYVREIMPENAFGFSLPFNYTRET